MSLQGDLGKPPAQAEESAASEEHETLAADLRALASGNTKEAPAASPASAGKEGAAAAAADPQKRPRADSRFADLPAREVQQLLRALGKGQRKRGKREGGKPEDLLETLRASVPDVD